MTGPAKLCDNRGWLFPDASTFSSASSTWMHERRHDLHFGRATSLCVELCMELLYGMVEHVCNM